MVRMQMRRIKSSVLLIVFLLYAAIVIFHPLSHHSVSNGKDSQHECSICLWLNNNTVDVSPIISFLVFFLVFYFVAAFSPIFVTRFCLSTQFSRAPPFSL